MIPLDYAVWLGNLNSSVNGYADTPVFLDTRDGNEITINDFAMQTV